MPNRLLARLASTSSLYHGFDPLFQSLSGKKERKILVIFNEKKKTYTQNQRSTDHMFYIYLFWSDLDLKIEFPNYLSLGKKEKEKGIDMWEFARETIPSSSKE